MFPLLARQSSANICAIVSLNTINKSKLIVLGRAYGDFNPIIDNSNKLSNEVSILVSKKWSLRMTSHIYTVALQTGGLLRRLSAKAPVLLAKRNSSSKNVRIIMYPINIYELNQII